MSRCTMFFSLALTASTFAFAGPFAPQQQAMCDSKSPQFLIADHIGDGSVLVGCYAPNNGRFQTRVLYTRIPTADVSVTPTKTGQVVTILSVSNFVRRVDKVVSPNNAIATSEAEWNIDPGSTILSATEKTFEIGSYSPEVRRYTVASTGELMTPQRNTGRKMGAGCGSFGKVLQGDEFCASGGALYRANATFAGANWKEAVQVMGGVGRIAAAEDFLYVAINRKDVYAPSLPCVVPCPPAVFLSTESPKIVRMKVVGFGEPAVEEVVVEPKMIWSSPLLVDGDNLYYTVYREFRKNEYGADDLANDVIVYNMKTKERKVLVRGEDFSYFPMIKVFPPGTFVTN